MTKDLVRRMQPNCLLGYLRDGKETYDKILRTTGDEVLVFRPQGKLPYTTLVIKDLCIINVIPPVRQRR